MPIPLPPNGNFVKRNRIVNTLNHDSFFPVKLTGDKIKQFIGAFSHKYMFCITSK